MANPVWRGATICPCMTAPLDELARRSGQDILVSPIPGFGSYQTVKTPSAGVGDGGGHLDLYLTRLNQEQKLRLEGLARQIGFYADIREQKWWSPTRQTFLKADWSPHLHMVLKSCGHRSSAATTQLDKWYAGGNGLVGNDPDDGDRRFLKQTWAQYLEKRDVPTPPQQTVDLAKLKFGRSNADVKLYQAAVWPALAASARAAILQAHHLKESQIVDGYFGKVTREMTRTLYVAIAAKEPHGEWPPLLEPGPRLLQRLGFIVRTSSRDLTNDRDEFGQPLGEPGSGEGAAVYSGDAVCSDADPVQSELVGH